MKNSNDTIGNRTRDLPAWSGVPQPTPPPRRPAYSKVIFSLLLVKLVRYREQSIIMRQQRNRPVVQPAV